jgi:hypothetical protein
VDEAAVAAAAILKELQGELECLKAELLQVKEEALGHLKMLEAAANERERLLAQIEEQRASADENKEMLGEYRSQIGHYKEEIEILKRARSPKRDRGAKSLEEEAAEVARQQSTELEIAKAVDDALRQTKEDHEAMLNMQVEDSLKREAEMNTEHETAMAELAAENEAAMDNVQEEFQSVLEAELERT